MTGEGEENESKHICPKASIVQCQRTHNNRAVSASGAPPPLAPGGARRDQPLADG